LAAALWGVFWAVDSAIEKWDWGTKTWWEAHTTHIKNWQTGLAFFLGLLVLALIEGSFRHTARREALRDRDISALNTTIKDLREELERERDQSKPKLRLHIHGMQTVECGDDRKDTLLMVSMTVENTGAPSIVKNLNGSLKVGDRVVQTVTMIGPSQDIRTTFPDGSFISFKRADYLPVKAYANAIQRGAGVVGWFQLMARNVDPTTAWNEGTLTITCLDVMDQPYNVSFSPAGQESGELLFVDKITQKQRIQSWTGEIPKPPSPQ
jgi:signal recognition particle subunit SEC65